MYRLGFETPLAKVSLLSVFLPRLTRLAWLLRVTECLLRNSTEAKIPPIGLVISNQTQHDWGAEIGFTGPSLLMFLDPDICLSSHSLAASNASPLKHLICGVYRVLTNTRKGKTVHSLWGVTSISI